MPHLGYPLILIQTTATGKDFAIVLWYDRGIVEITKGIILPPEQLRLVLELTAAHLPSVEVWAYGSRVRGNPRRYSDLDLVAFTGQAQLAQVENLREAFEECDLPIRVDLFVWDGLPDSFHRQIRRKYVVLQAGAKSAATATS